MADEVLPPGLEPVTDPALIATLEKTQAQIDKEDPAGGGKGGAYSQSALDAFNRAIETGNRLLTHKGMGAAVGSGLDPQSWGSFNPLSGQPFAGTSAKDFMANLDAMKAQVFLPMVQSMKGMGALSNAEGQKLTDAIGALDPGMSEDAFKESLQRIIGDLTAYRDRAAAEGKAGGTGAPAAAAAATPPAGGPREFGAPPPPGPPLTPEQQTAYDLFWKTNPNATADQLRAFGPSIGINIENADDIIAARNQGAGVAAGATAQLGLTQQEQAEVNQTAAGTDEVGAGLMGAADTITMGTLDKAGAAATAFRDSLAGKGSFSDVYGRRVMINDAIIDQVQEDSPWWYGGGQVAGGLVLPTFGARTPAQLAKVGAAYGAAYGAGSSDSLAEVPGNVITGGAIGGATGWGGGKLLQRLGSRGGEAAAAGEATEAVADRYARGQRFGLDLSVGDVRGMGAKATERLLDVQPGSAGVMNAERAKLGGQIENAVDQVGATYGSNPSFRGMGEAAQAGVRKWADKFENVAAKAYQAIPISDAAKANLTNTTTALAEMTNIFASNPKMAERFKNQRLNGYLEDLTDKAGGGLSWSDLKAFRSRIGEEIGDQRFSDSPTKTELRRLYSALSEDMRVTASAQGPQAAKAFDRANTLYRQGQERIDNAVKFLVGDDMAMTPEKAAARIQAMVKSGKASSDLGKLAEIRKSLPPQEAGELSSGLIRMLGQPNNSEGRTFNAETFIRNFNDMAPEAKNLLFGGANKELRANLEDFAKVMGDVAANNSTRNTSKTAMGLAGLVGYGSGGPAGLLAQAGGSYVLAKAWTNPKFVRWATGYGRMLRGAARAGQEPTAEGMTRQANLLTKIAGSDPALTQDIIPIREAILSFANDNVARSAAASGSDQQQQR